MPRRRVAVKREISPDYRYQDKIIAKFVNVLMRNGKKSLASSIFYNTMENIKERVKDEPLKVFRKAIDNVKPVLEVKSRRVGGSTYQIPVEVGYERRIALAVRWIIESAKKRSEYGMISKLTQELIEASNNTGLSVKKKEETHKMAEANKAFAHYRW